MDVAVRARNLGKTYKIYERPADRLIEAITRSSRHRDFPSLAGVSFDLPRGASLGLIGENGAGKSTLLKIVAGTTTPSEGTIATSGTVASILELGMGFHPEFSGLENARINAALLGLSSAEMKRRLPEIREFSELGEFFDRPVKTYSSGMALRLAFSVATHVDADVLIIDEALAVGDGYFQKKSIDRIVEFKKRGGTLLFCSHAMYYIAMICDEAMWIDHGKARELGPAVPVIAKYESFLEQKERRSAAAPAAAPRFRGGSRRRSPSGRPRRFGISAIGIRGERDDRGRRGVPHDRAVAVVSRSRRHRPRRWSSDFRLRHLELGSCAALRQRAVSGSASRSPRFRFRMATSRSRRSSPTRRPFILMILRGSTRDSRCTLRSTSWGF